jgi:ATP-dependent protease ClpP protease subunit
MIRKIIGLSLLAGLILIGISLGRLVIKDITYLSDYSNISKLGTYIAQKSSTIILEGPVVNKYAKYFKLKKGVSKIELQKSIVDMQNLVANGHKDITIIINSGGGIVDSDSQRFLAYLEYLKLETDVDVTCIIDGKAASMALIIFSRCEYRLATANSWLLWHSIRRSGIRSMNQPEAERFVEWSTKANENLHKAVTPHFLPWYFDKHFRAESRLSVIEVENEGYGFLRVINKLIKLK